MAVLNLRRDMVVVEEDPVVEIDTPFPLRTIDAEVAEIADASEIEDDDHHDHRPRNGFVQTLRLWFNIIAAIVVVCAYPAMMISASDVGDRNVSSTVDRTRWTAPWAGGASTLMEKHFNDLGWASDAPGWAPMARLTAKPAFQSAMAGAIGEFVTLTHNQVAIAGQDDPDLTAAARLITQDSTGVQLRAARDALVSYDRRQRRRASAIPTTPAQIGEQLALINGWGVRSQAELAATSTSLGGSPIDDSATKAVYAAKGVAAAAYTFIDAMHWPDAAKSQAARSAALAAWKSALEFHPLIVLNGSPDGSLLGNHPASMGYLLIQAQKATEEMMVAVKANAPPPVVAPAPEVVEAPPPVETPPPAKAKKAVKPRASKAAVAQPAVAPATTAK